MKMVAPEVHLPPATTAMAEVATMAMEKEDIRRHLVLATTSMEKAAMEDRLLDTRRKVAMLATPLQEDMGDIHHQEGIHHQDMEEAQEEEGIRRQVMAEALLDMTDMAKVQAMVMATARAAPLVTIIAMEREAMTTDGRNLVADLALQCRLDLLLLWRWRQVRHSSAIKALSGTIDQLG